MIDKENAADTLNTSDDGGRADLPPNDSVSEEIDQAILDWMDGLISSS